MTPVTSASLAALVASAAASALPQLQLGDVLTGIVIAALDDSVLRLQLPAGTIDVATDVPLAPGTRVTLAVEGTSQQPKLVLSPIADGSNARPPQAIDPSGSGVATRIASTDVAQTPVTSLAGRLQQAAGSVDGRAALVAGAANAARNVSPSVPPESPPVLAPDPSSAAATIVRAVARQDGLAPLYANLEAVLRQPNLAAPGSVVDAARQLLALRLDIRGAGAVDAADIKSALAKSGIATDLVAPKELSPASGVVDLGTGLATLRRALKDWLAAEPLARPVSAPPAARPSEPQAASRAAAPMPPYRNAPTVPQAPVAPSILDGAAPREVATRLLDHTDAVIARQSLLQVAALPDDPMIGAAHADNNAVRLTFDIPMATMQGTAVAQIRIEHDGHHRGEQTKAPVWRADFSIDLEPIGKVHARIALVGDRATVTLNAERPGSADELLAGLGLLEAGLRDADLEPGELRCHAGAPRTPQAAPGLFVDHAS